MSRVEIIKGIGGFIELTVRDLDGAPIDADDLPTATVKDSAGAAVGGTFESEHQGAAGSGLYRITFAPSDLIELDLYEVTWAVTVDDAARSYSAFVEVVGDILVAPWELREFNAEIDATTAQITEAIASVTQRLEGPELLGYSCRRRARRERLDGTGLSSLVVKEIFVHKLRAASIDTGDGPTALTEDELAAVVAYEHGQFVRIRNGDVWDAGNGNVEVLYEYGLEHPPDIVARAVKIMADRQLKSSPLPQDNVVSQTTEQGTVRFSVEGRDGPTGIPEVDAVIAQIGQPRAGVA